MRLERYSGWVARLLVASLMALAGLSGMRPSSAQEVSVSEPGTRVLHFPKDRSLGTLRVQIDRNPNWHYISQTPGEYEWAYFGDAKGDVALPVGKRLTLGVREDAWNDLAPLEKLAPDDLHRLAFYGSYTGGEKPGDSCLSHLGALTGLKELVLWNVDVTHQGLERLKKLPSLKTLELYSASFGEKEIDVLAELTSLEKLKMFLPHATDAHLSRLAKVKSLSELQFCWVPEIKGPGLARLLAESPSLRSLEPYSQDFDNSNLKYLANAPFLKRIRFSRKMPITDAGLEHLSSLTQLEDLRVFDNPITDAGLVHLKSMGSLRRLTLDQTQVTDDGMALVKQLGSLESLSVPSHLTDRGLAQLVELPRLKHLWAGGSSSSPITDEGLASLARVRSLEELLIGGTGITDAGLPHITRLTRLKHLALFYAPLITDEGVAHLTDLKSLTLLELPRSEITIAGLAPLNTPELRMLIVRSVRQDGTGLALSGLTKLEKLTICPKVTREKDSLVWDSLRDEDLACLANLTRLKWLQGIRGDISDAGMAHLAGLRNMERLNINGPGITNKGLSYLTQMKKLNHLTLTGNFTDEGLRHLEGLKALSLLRIYSSDNFSPAALQQLKNSLPNLQVLNADPDRAIAPLARRPEVVQDMAPSFAVQTLDGKEIKLRDYRGKVVLLYFWATWCTPCVVSTPALKKFYEELSEYDDFAMLSLSMDVDETRLRQHVEQHRLSWPQARIGMYSQIAADYGVTGAPAYVLVAPDGRVLLHRERDWNKIKAEVDKLLSPKGQ